ncbi:hypothetical protein OSTOST_16474, partial [Ostertagia ostertagi]
DEGVNTAVAQQTPVPTDQCRTASEPTSKPTDDCKTACSPSSKPTETPKEEQPPSMGTPHHTSEKTTDIDKDQIKKVTQSGEQNIRAKSPQPSDGPSLPMDWTTLTGLLWLQSTAEVECPIKALYDSPHRYRFVVPMVVLADIKGKIYRLTTHYTVTITSCSTGQGTFTESSPIDVEKKKGHKQ